MAEIRIDGVSKTFRGGKTPAVRDLSLTVHDRELLVLLGPSGCGKTTLLRMIAGLEYPDRGVIAIGGQDVTGLPPRKRGIAMVFQSYAVFPHMTVFDNIAFGLKMRRAAQPEIKKRVEQAAAMLALEPYLGRYSAQLSGGQRQRVAVARAIVVEPSVLLMDEPLSNLDALLRLQFRAELKKLVRDVQTTTVYVTHDQVEAMSLGDRVAVMRDGEILQIDEPMAVYDRPADAFVGSFIGTPPMNFLRVSAERSGSAVECRIGSQRFARPSAELPPNERDVLLGIRAEHIRLSADGGPGSLAAEVLVVEPLGSYSLVTVILEGQIVKVAASRDLALAPGEPVSLRLEPDKIRWFSA
jgi:multiple sugar transport system ATP-binding protein